MSDQTEKILLVLAVFVILFVLFNMVNQKKTSDETAEPV